MIKEKLGNIISFQRGYDLTHSQMHGGNVPVIGSSEIIGWHDVSKNKAPTLLIGRSGTVGRPQYYNSDAWPHNTTLFVTDYHGNNPKYCYYLLQNMNLEDYANSSGVPTLNRNFIEPLIVEYHKKEEQDKIADILGNIDNKILANKKIIATSERLMREIYDYWFVQFDFPDENSRPYKSSGGEMVYNEILKREIPKGWKVQNLLNNDLASEIKPGISKFDGIKTYYATANIMGSCINTGSNIDYEYRESRANMQPIANSLWFAKMKNSIKHITVLPSSLDLINSSIFSTGFFGIRAKKCALPYLRSFLHSDYFEKVKDLNSNGATMEAISNDGIKNIKLLTPDKQALMGFADKTADLLNNMDILRQENKKLASLRDWLLPMLMNGQVMVDDRILNNNAPERVEDDNIGLY